jgi:hypothetical protein
MPRRILRRSGMISTVVGAEGVFWEEYTEDHGSGVLYRYGSASLCCHNADECRVCPQAIFKHVQCM